MKIKVFKNEEFAGRCAADAIIAVINAKPDAILGLPTGSTPLTTYHALATAVDEGRVSFKDVSTFNLDEYVGLPETHEQSYRFFMNSNLFNHIDIDKKNTHLPCENSANLTDAEAAAYDARINAAGGIDFQLLGIGGNGHIAFNEPGVAIDSLTHKQKITPETRVANSRFFDNDPEKVPEYAVTLGIKGIMNARKIVLLAFGKGKAQAVYDTVCGKVDPKVPASILQLHPDVTIMLDEDAAAMIK